MTMTPARIMHSITFYPLSLAWVGGILVAAGISSDCFSLIQGLAVWSSFVLLMVMYGMWRELRIVHTLVNSQHDQLVARNDQLLALLNASGISVPPQKRNPK